MQNRSLERTDSFNYEEWKPWEKAKEFGVKGFYHQPNKNYLDIEYNPDADLDKATSWAVISRKPFGTITECTVGFNVLIFDPNTTNGILKRYTLEKGKFQPVNDLLREAIDLIVCERQQLDLFQN